MEEIKVKKFRTVQHFDEVGDAHELTFSCYCRRPFLCKDRTRLYFLEALDRARKNSGFHLWAYVIMPEHVHLLVWHPEDNYSTAGFLKSVKQSVARRAIGYVRAHAPESLRLFDTGQQGCRYRFWENGPGYDRNVTKIATLSKMFDYIHENPVLRGLVDYPEDWYWSSARAWATGEDIPISIDREFFPDL
jgi:putative transposase